MKSRLADPYGLAIMAELQRRGIPFVGEDSQLVGQLGPARRYTGRNARSELFLRVGNDRLTAPPGSPRVAVHDGLSAAEQQEVAQLQSELADYIRQGRLRLNSRGEEALRRQGGVAPPNLTDPLALFATGQLVLFVNHGDLQLDRTWAPRFARYAYLEGQWDIHTVQLYLAPLPGPRPHLGSAVR